jgi:hypothetical protein
LDEEVAAHIVGVPLELEDVVVKLVVGKAAVVGVFVEDPVEEASVALPERHAQVNPHFEQVGGPVGRVAQVLEEWGGPFKVCGGKLESAGPEVEGNIHSEVVEQTDAKHLLTAEIGLGNQVQGPPSSGVVVFKRCVELKVKVT